MTRTCDYSDLPEFSTECFVPKRTQYAVIIPVINEGARIQTQLRKMKAAHLPTDIIVVDGGSVDGSLDREFLTEVGVSVLLTKRGPGKLSAQLRIGFAYALQLGYDGVITIDGNGKDDFLAIPQFIHALAEGYDFVQGSRYLPGGKAINTPRDRHLAVKFIHAPLLSWASGFRYTDTTNGFRAFSARILSDPRVQPFRLIFDTYNLHYYLSMRAAKLGFRVKEIPVTRAYPNHGPVPSKISGMSGKIHILKQLILTVVGAYNPKEK